MERCPNCGQMGRAGARFCTICGYRIADDASNGELAATESRENPVNDGNSSDASTGADNWPAPPANGPLAADGCMTPEPTESEISAPEPPAPEAADEELPSIWSTNSGDSWPSAPERDSQDLANCDATGLETATVLSEDTIIETESALNSEAAATNTEQRDRAVRLIDELRGLVVTMGGAAPLDLSGVIAELEVAVTPPGAVGTEDLATLREALLAARQRPRDIDTVVDLTGRIDAMVALIFAYDRAIAAIERSLDVLRRE